MKKTLLVFTVLILSLKLSAQYSMSSLFNKETKVVFLGLDFTQAKFIGKEGFSDPSQIGFYYFAKWNRILVDEDFKFSLAKVLKSKNYETFTNDFTLYNEGIDVELHIQEEPYQISEREVAASVSKYELTKTDGIGVIYIVESLNKTLETAAVWVTFIDLSTKKILFTKRLKGTAQGFGFRNYWLGAIYSIHKNLQYEYKYLKKRFK